jgi:Domain of unknown function (DUF4331)
MTAVTARKTLWVALAGLVLAAVLTMGPRPTASSASSHREAPLISKDPLADNTDVYAFRSPDRPDTVTLIANYIPLQAPASGPNFWAFDDEVLYAIHVDNDGDGREDITYEFDFDTTLRNPATFLYNTGPITSLDDPDWNMPQTYSVTRVQGGHRTVLASGVPTPPVNIGPRSTPDYESLAADAVADVGDGVKVFAGQRDDGFYVDLGAAFDLLGLRPFNAFHVIPLVPEPGVDAVARTNTHTIAIQVPITQVAFPSTTIGVYASASRRKIQINEPHGKQSSQGPFVQVSRLGEPLINEVVIPLGQKDFWNSQDPSGDEQFVDSYRSPETARLINALYPATEDIRETDRDDLVAILLTGVPGLNFTGETKADLLRLNTEIAPTAPVGAGNRLGVLAGDLAGFPNGRRLEDDVVDIEIRAIAEGYGPFLNALLGLPNKTPNNQLGDGVDANDKPFMTSFPYQATPHQGYEVP